MASSVAYAVDDSPAVLVWDGGNGRRDVAIHNAGPSSVFLGGSTVTAAQGFPLASGDSIGCTPGETEDIYAICDTGGTASVRVLQVAAEG